METQWAGLSVCSGAGAKFEKKMSARLPFVHVECASVCATERGRGHERYSNNSTSSWSEPQTALKVMPKPHRSHLAGPKSSFSSTQQLSPPIAAMSPPEPQCGSLHTKEGVCLHNTGRVSPPGGATLFSIQQGWGERGGHGKRILTNSAS